MFRPGPTHRKLQIQLFAIIIPNDDTIGDHLLRSVACINAKDTRSAQERPEVDVILIVAYREAMQ